MTTHVLLLCTHNSARSVLAEGMLEHWARRRAFELPRQVLAYRMLQLLALPLDTMDRAALQQALADIAKA